jgi:anti-sigma regulatory factor (Ser/Thr protein kinase)
MWPLRTHLELGALPGAVPCTRLHTKLVLWEWGLGSLSEVAELLTSELVTNAVQATLGWTIPVPVRLRLSSDKACLLIEVWDADPRPPTPKALDADSFPPLDEGGRGLFLVAALSKRSGWYPVPDRGGKVVWAEVAELGACDAPIQPISAAAEAKQQSPALPNCAPSLSNSAISMIPNRYPSPDEPGTPVGSAERTRP